MGGITDLETATRLEDTVYLLNAVSIHTLRDSTDKANLD